MNLRAGELPLMQQLVKQLAGVALDDGKGYLIESRLGPIAEKAGCTNFNELYFKLRYGADPKLTQQVVDFVLHPPRKEELPEIEHALARCLLAWPRIAAGDYAGAQQQLHGKAV